MQEDSELDMTIECIRSAVEEIEGMTGNEAVSRMRELFDSIVSQYRDHAGMQAIMLSMAMGDIRHMDSLRAEVCSIHGINGPPRTGCSRDRCPGRRSGKHRNASGEERTPSYTEPKGT